MTSMSALNTAPTWELETPRLSVAGDFHGSVSWVRNFMRTVRSEVPDVTTILQLGDWWMGLGVSDELAAEFGIERVLVTLGDHEPYPQTNIGVDALDPVKASG